MSTADRANGISLYVLNLSRLRQLSFATGSPIPLHLTFSSADEQALDLLSSAGAIRFHLFRERLIGSHAIKEGAVGQSNNTFREVMSSAVFWPSQEGAQEPGKRKLQGELEVRKGLRPTFVFPRFTLRVSVPSSAGTLFRELTSCRLL